jgi:hypothetical protein
MYALAAARYVGVLKFSQNLFSRHIAPAKNAPSLLYWLDTFPARKPSSLESLSG